MRMKEQLLRCQWLVSDLQTELTRLRVKHSDMTVGASLLYEYRKEEREQELALIRQSERTACCINLDHSMADCPHRSCSAQQQAERAQIGETFNLPTRRQQAAREREARKREKARK